MSNCHDNTAVAGCHNDGVNPPVSVVIHYRHDDGGAPAVFITDIEGNVITSADSTNTTVGACALPPADTEFTELCDVQADGSSISFIRRKIVTISGLGVPNVAVADFELDYVTPYVVTGTASSCPTCPDLDGRGLQSNWLFLAI